jgi:hypothetical protein
MNNAMKIIDDEESISSRMDEETAKWDRGQLKGMINGLESADEDS